MPYQIVSVPARVIDEAQISAQNRRWVYEPGFDEVRGDIRRLEQEAGFAGQLATSIGPGVTAFQQTALGQVRVGAVGLQPPA